MDAEANSVDARLTVDAGNVAAADGSTVDAGNVAAADGSTAADAVAGGADVAAAGATAGARRGSDLIVF